MATPQQKHGIMADRAGFEELRKAVMDHSEDAEIIQAFFNSAVKTDNIAVARSIFDQLQPQHPWNHQIRKLRIALRLHQKDYPAAMDTIESLLAFSRPDDALIETALTVRNYLGPRKLSSHQQNTATISLCMIAKNEQALLGPCLNSIKKVVDEIIFIDTGSSDHSADIARIYGAQVSDFKWCDDFSAARNTSLAKAHGDWILILDADEIIAPRDHTVLKKMVAEGMQSNSAYAFQTRNYSNLANTMEWQANDQAYPEQETGIGWFPTNKVRLFKRSNKIRFIYPVHELVDPSIKTAGMTITQCPIPIHHYGHINETKNAHKALHYFELGYAKLEQLGNDRVALRELAVQAGRLERWPETIELWERLLELTPQFGEAYANIAGAYWQLGKYEKGVLFSQKAIDIDPNLKEGRYNLAANRMMRGQAHEAVLILNALLLRYPKYLAAEFMLGAALSLSGELPKSRAIFKSLVEKISNQGLKIAIGDLKKKLADSGFANHIDGLSKAAGFLRGQTI